MTLQAKKTIVVSNSANLSGFGTVPNVSQLTYSFTCIVSNAATLPQLRTAKVTFTLNVNGGLGYFIVCLTNTGAGNAAAGAISASVTITGGVSNIGSGATTTITVSAGYGVFVPSTMAAATDIASLVTITNPTFSLIRGKK
jgi:hypothetical protein